VAYGDLAREDLVNPATVKALHMGCVAEKPVAQTRGRATSAPGHLVISESDRAGKTLRTVPGVG
jgi:hypothetical protein